MVYSLPTYMYLVVCSRHITHSPSIGDLSTWFLYSRSCPEILTRVGWSWAPLRSVSQMPPEFFTTTLMATLHFSLLDSQLPSVHSIFLFDINSYFGSVDLLYCSKHEFWRVTLLENLLAQTVFSISSYFINSATARASHSLTSLTTARCREPEVSDTQYCSLRHGRPCVLAPHRSTLPALRRQPSLLMCPCSPCYLRTPPPITCVVGTGQCLPQPTSTPWSLPKVLPDCFLPCQFSNY